MGFSDGTRSESLCILSYRSKSLLDFVVPWLSSATKARDVSPLHQTDFLGPRFAFLRALASSRISPAGLACSQPFCSGFCFCLGHRCIGHE